jgi:hypothetical protein
MFPAGQSYRVERSQGPNDPQTPYALARPFLPEARLFAAFPAPVVGVDFAALISAHRFRVASTILLRPSGLSRLRPLARLVPSVAG